MKAGEQTIQVLGFPTSSMDRTSILQTVERWITNRDACHHLMALNPIKVYRARKERELAAHILEADLVYPDGVGISWAMSLFTGKTFRPIPGCDLMLDLMSMASANANRVFLFGASESVVSKTREVFQKQYPGARIVGIRHGFFSHEEERAEATRQILAANPDMVFVAMGARIQEDWIDRLKETANRQGVVIPLLMGVGGSFDAATGELPRPPKWMLKWHLEWLSRLLRQPTRIIRMSALPVYAMLVLGKHFLRLDLDYRQTSPTNGRKT